MGKLKQKKKANFLTYRSGCWKRILSPGSTKKPRESFVFVHRMWSAVECTGVCGLIVDKYDNKIVIEQGPLQRNVVSLK